MEDVESRLAAIGYRGLEPEPECWRVSQITAPGPLARPGPVSRPGDPARSLALRLWLGRLAKGERSRPYRISRAPGGPIIRARAGCRAPR